MIVPPVRPLLLVLTLLLTVACDRVGVQQTVEGSGTPAEEAREVPSFHTVSFTLPGTLFIEQGEGEALRLEGDDNLLAHVVTRVRGGELEITAENTRLAPSVPLRVYLTTPQLEAIRSAGAGRIEAPELRVDELSLSIAGSGGAHLPGLQAEVLRVQLAGSADVELSGSVRRHELSLAGSGDVQARELESEVVQATIAGTGNAIVRVRDQLTASLVGTGSLRYLGDPQVSSTTVGTGRVVREGS